MRHTFAALFLILAACSASTPKAPEPKTGDYTSDAFDQHGEQALLDCACWFGSYGYANASACVMARSFFLTPAGAACMHQVGLAYPQFEAHEACQDGHEIQRTNCYRGLTVCDVNAWNACDAAVSTCQPACPSGDVACQDAYSAYTAAVSRCATQ